MDLRERIRTGQPLVLDGAMGTELDRREVPIDLAVWSARALESHGHVVREIHEDYVRAGAEVHIANTFATGRHVLEAAGLGDSFERFNREAVALCRQAITDAGRGRPMWVAGSISTYAESSDRGKLPPIDRLRANFVEQATLLAEAGVDLFALEMLADVEAGVAAVEAAASTGLPVSIGFTCVLGDDGSVHTREPTMAGAGPLLEDVLVGVLAGVPPGTDAYVAIMHSDFDVVDRALDVVARHWPGPLLVYPNSGLYEKPHWRFDTVCAPAELVSSAQRWLDRGVVVVGGCCGLGPEHIRALAAHVAAR